MKSRSTFSPNVVRLDVKSAKKKRNTEIDPNCLVGASFRPMSKLPLLSVFPRLPLKGVDSSMLMSV